MKTGGLTFIRIIIAVLAIFALVVIGYQLYKYNFVSIKTESAVMGELEEVVKSTGLFFRNEEIIDRRGYEYFDVIRAEGERVPAHGVIARIYNDEASAKKQKKIRELEAKIKTYEDVLSNSGSYQSAIASIDSEIYDNLENISYMAQKGDSSVFSDAEALLVELMKKKIASGDLVHYDSVLKDLRDEEKRLKASVNASGQTISTGKSGYFSYGLDGLESQFSLESMKTLSTDNFESMLKLCKKSTPTADDLGKVVYDSSWSVALKLKTSDITLLEINDTVYIRIPSYGSERIKCTVADIRKNGEESVVILESSVINDNILTLRNEEISLIIRTYNGIQLRQSALRKVDGKDGVFVKVGLLLRYKEVEILYNDGVNVIVKYDATATSGLRIYDQVVYKGSNLYNGKAVSDG